MFPDQTSIGISIVLSYDWRWDFLREEEIVHAGSEPSSGTQIQMGGAGGAGFGFWLRA
jgi:hypothetical protein